MRLLLQRAQRAHVEVAGEVVGEIGSGLVVFVGVFPDDNRLIVDRLVERMLGLRIFADDDKPMNRSVADVGGGVLLVSQFTLAADTSRGRRPGFSTAAAPAVAQELYDYLVETTRAAHPDVATGEFGADMQVHLVNDGPVTFLLENPAP